MKTIKIILKEDGSTIVDMNGFVGKECEFDYKRLVEQLRKMGIEIDEEKVEKKNEYHLVKRSEKRAVLW